MEKAMTGAPFTIDKVSWHTGTPGNPETREHVIRRFYVLAAFLQDNGLVTTTMARSEEDISDDFEISTKTLTPEGIALLRESYDRWLAKADDDPLPTTEVLKRALARLRARAK